MGSLTQTREDQEGFLEEVMLGSAHAAIGINWQRAGECSRQRTWLQRAWGKKELGQPKGPRVAECGQTVGVRKGLEGGKPAQARWRRASFTGQRGAVGRCQTGGGQGCRF